MAKRASTTKTRKTTKSKAAKSASPKKKTSKKTTKKSTRASKKKAPSKKKPATKKKTLNPAEKEVTIDRRRNNRREEESAIEAGEPKVAPTSLERRKKVNRRRQIDPTTCERDYSDQEVEFMSAMDEYKRVNGRMFPTCSEVLEVIRKLGYVQLPVSERAAQSAEPIPPVEQSENTSFGFETDNDPQEFGEPVGVGAESEFLGL